MIFFYYVLKKQSMKLKELNDQKLINLFVISNKYLEFRT